MKDLLAEARRRAVEAEVYWSTREPISVRFQNGQPVAVLQDAVDQCTVRVIRDGKLGMACGSRPDSSLLRAAEEAADAGAEAAMHFADTKPLLLEDATDTNVDAEVLLDLAHEVQRSVLSERSELALIVHATCHRETLRIATSEGFEGSQRSQYITLHVGAPFYQAGSGVSKTHILTDPRADADAIAREFLGWYTWGDRISSPPAGQWPVLLAPEAAFLLTMPLCAGLSGETLHQRTSPLEHKLGERILCRDITLRDAPLKSGDPLGRRFDDEGTACQQRTIVDSGMLTGYLLDRRTAGLLGETPTGNGFKRALFGAGPWAAPNPWPARPTLEGGSTSWKDLLEQMDQGLLVYGGMGFHSANYLQGSFSVQALGYHVENGKVQGRLHGVMVAGNIYEHFLGVSVSREVVPLQSHVSPYIRVPELQVAHGG